MSSSASKRKKVESDKSEESCELTDGKDEDFQNGSGLDSDDSGEVRATSAPRGAQTGSYYLGSAKAASNTGSLESTTIYDNKTRARSQSFTTYSAAAASLDKLSESSLSQLQNDSQTLSLTSSQKSRVSHAADEVKAGIVSIGNFFSKAENKKRMWRVDDVAAAISKVQGGAAAYDFMASIISRGREDGDLHKRRVCNYLLFLAKANNREASNHGTRLMHELMAHGLNDNGVKILADNLGLSYTSTVRSWAKQMYTPDSQRIQLLFQRAAAEQRMVVVIADDCTLPVQFLDTQSMCPVRVHTMTNILLIMLKKGTAHARIFRENSKLDVLQPHKVAENWTKWYAESALSEICSQMVVGGYVSRFGESYSNKAHALERRAVLADFQYGDVERARLHLSACSGVHWVDTLNFPPKSWGDMFKIFNYLLSNGMAQYLERFNVVAVGDHPMQSAWRKASRIFLNRNEQQLAFKANFQYATEAAELAMSGVVSIPGPFHQGLNVLSTLFEKFAFLFRSMHARLYTKKRPDLPDKVRPRVLHYLATVMLDGWLSVRVFVLGVLREDKRRKFAEVSTLLYFFETLLPLGLDHYSVVFKSKNFATFQYSVAFLALVCIVWQRRNYDKSTLIWLAQAKYWRDTPACATFSKFFEESFTFIDESFVERFNSIVKRRCKYAADFKSVRRTAASVLDEGAGEWRESWAKTRMRKDVDHNVLAEHSKAAQVWILELFVSAGAKNATTAYEPPAGSDKPWLYELPHVHGANILVDSTQLPLAFSTSIIPSPDTLCDWCVNDEKAHKKCTAHGKERTVDYLHCGHALCRCEHCRRLTAEIPEEKLQCDICFAFIESETVRLGAAIDKILLECGAPDDVVDLGDGIVDDGALDDENDAGNGDPVNINATLIDQRRVDMVAMIQAPLQNAPLVVKQTSTMKKGAK